MSGPAPHIFISYARADRDRALAIADALEAAGIPVWFDQRGIGGGTQWTAEITAAIRSASAVAVLCSDASMSSRNVRQELQLAWDHNKPILPLILEAAEFPDSVAYFLHGTQWIEVLDRPNAEWIREVIIALSRSERIEHLDKAVQQDGAPATSAVDLPEPLNELFGREAELGVIASLLSRYRLVTLTGPGGVGKTRLAIEAARIVAGSYPDGVGFADLSPLADSQLVTLVLSQALGVQEAGNRGPIDAISARIRDQRRFLVVDNFEHVIDAAPEIAKLLARCPRLTLLVSSREPLVVRGEHVVLIEPFSVPTTPSEMLVDVIKWPAVALFVSRAQERDPRFVLAPENAGTILAICTQLDGLPLAIELAAAQTRLLEPESLLSMLQKRPGDLKGDARDLPARQRTLRDTVSWSYNLLSPQERLLFRRLSVFAGGCSIEAAEAVCNSGGELDLLATLSSLVDKSLVQQLRQTGVGSRFTMLETVRSFALDQLREEGESNSARNTHANWCMELAEQAFRACVRGSIQPVWLTRVAVEIGNMRAALDWYESISDGAAGLRLASALSPLWTIAGQQSEVDRWLGHWLPVGGAADIEVCARAQYWAGVRAMNRAKLDEAQRHSSKSLELYEEIGDNWGRAVALGSLGLVESERGNYDEARGRLLAALSIFRPLADHDWIALVNQNLGSIALAQGHFDDATERFHESLAINTSIADPWGITGSLSGLGATSIDQNRPAEAAEYLLDAWSASQALSLQASGVADLLELSAAVCAQAMAPAAAARLLGAAEAHREFSGERPRTADQRRVDALRASLTEQLGEASFQAARALGQATTLETEVASALQWLRNISGSSATL